MLWGLQVSSEELKNLKKHTIVEMCSVTEQILNAALLKIQKDIINKNGSLYVEIHFT
jgi:hypothetical protein